MKKRYQIILVLSIVIVIGFTWSLDMPVALQVPLRQQPYQFTNLQFNLIYFSTYFPICFSDIPVGILLDKFPIHLTIIIISTTSILSQLFTLIMFNTMIYGYKVIIYMFRGVFGITGEASFTILTLLMSKYAGKYYDSFIGVGLCMPYFFDSLNNVLTPIVYDMTGSMVFVWGIGTLVCGISLSAAISISLLIRKDNQQIEQLKKLKKIQQQEKYVQEKVKQQQQKLQEQPHLNFNGLKKLSKQFWIITLTVFAVQYNIAAYFDNLNDMIVKRFQIPYVSAGYLMFIPYGLAALFSFIIGKVLQINPFFRRKSILISSILYSIGLLILYLLPNVQIQNQPTYLYYILIGIQFLSVSYGLAILYTCLTPSIKYVVDENNLGVAWGVIGSAIGLSSAFGPVITALVLQTGNNLAEGYQNLTLSIFLTNFFAIVFSFWIWKGQFKSIDVTSSQQKIDKTDDNFDSKEEILLSSTIQNIINSQ